MNAPSPAQKEPQSEPKAGSASKAGQELFPEALVGWPVDQSDERNCRSSIVLLRTASVCIRRKKQIVLLANVNTGDRQSGVTYPSHQDLVPRSAGT